MNKGLILIFAASIICMLGVIYAVVHFLVKYW
jgi:hypothetical protein